MVIDSDDIWCEWAMRLLDEGGEATSEGRGTWRTSWEAMLRRGTKWADRQACRDFFVCTASNQPRGPLACGGGAGDTFSRAGSGVGGDDVIGGMRWWRLVSRCPS